MHACRRTPAFIKEQKMEHSRLPILFYLVYRDMDPVLPKELFTKATYKIVKRSTNFTKLINAILRIELKPHTVEEDMTSVIKSGQFVRIISHVLKEKLEDMERHCRRAEKMLTVQGICWLLVHFYLPDAREPVQDTFFN